MEVTGANGPADGDAAASGLVAAPGTDESAREALGPDPGAGRAAEALGPDPGAGRAAEAAGAARAARPPLSGCRAREVLNRVGDKWSVMVIDRLGQGSHRFSELRRDIEGITGRMLTVTLRGLERDGLVARTIHPVIPPRVDYELTPMGRTLLQTIEQLIDWADGHVSAIHAAQAAYDAKHSAEGAEGAGPVDPEISGCEAAARAAANGCPSPAS